MMNLSCDMQSLVLARLDGRLGAKDIVSVERHIHACRACSELAAVRTRVGELGRRLGEEDVMSPLERRRARVALMRDAAKPREQPARRGAVANWRVQGMVAAAILSVLAMWGVLRGPDASQHNPASAPSDQRDAKLATAAVALPAIDVSIESPSRADYRHERNGPVERVRLTDGTIDIRLAHLSPGQRFIVATGDAEVEVRGTDFAVVAIHDALQSVAVREGRVEVRCGNVTTMLGVGDTWSAPTAQRESEDASALARSSTPEPTRAPPSQKAVAPSAPAETPDAAASPDGLAEAVGMIEDGDYSAGSKALEAFVQANEGNPRAEDAAFLAVVALERAGQADQVLAAAKRYLTRFPRGARRADVEAIAAAHPASTGR